jgi:hypothetical protein
VTDCEGMFRLVDGKNYAVLATVNPRWGYMGLGEGDGRVLALSSGGWLLTATRLSPDARASRVFTSGGWRRSGPCSGIWEPTDCRLVSVRHKNHTDNMRQRGIHRHVI